MGVDLTLLPIRYDHQTWWLAYDRIRFTGNYELHRRIRDVESCAMSSPVAPKVLQWYGDNGIEDATTDRYGDPLRVVFAADLSKIELPDDITGWTRATFEFVKSLPGDTKLVLWWH
jgi:hypothetical protein